MFCYEIDLTFLAIKNYLLKETVQRDFRPPGFFIIRTGLGFVYGFIFAEIFEFFESPRIMILGVVKLHAVLYCAESSSAQYHTARTHVTFPYPF